MHDEVRKHRCGWRLRNRSRRQHRERDDKREPDRRGGLPVRSAHATGSSTNAANRELSAASLQLRYRYRFESARKMRATRTLRSSMESPSRRTTGLFPCQFVIPTRLKEGKVDVGIAAITISKERESYADFSNSMYEAGLRILTRTQQSDGTAMMLGLM